MGSIRNHRAGPRVTRCWLGLIFAALSGFAACDSGAPDPIRAQEAREESTREPSATRPPNILLIIADDVGVDEVGIYAEGPNPANTPNIDAIARRGVLFRNTWSNPVCSSTRATILTGRYSFRTGVGFVARPGADLKDREHTLPEVLARHPSASYGTAAFGKWHLNSGGPSEDKRQSLSAPYRAGFTFFRGTFKNIGHSYFSWPEITLGERAGGGLELSGGERSTGYNTSEIVNDAAAWIRDFERARPEDPWFVWLAFNAAHRPFHKPPAALHTVDLDDPTITCRNPEPFDHPERLEPCFRAMIEAMDHEIGRLLDREIAKESLTRTAIVFVGDNGSVKGIAESPERANRMKGTTYEGGIHVPLIFAGAGVSGSAGAGARERHELVNTTDLFATVLAMTGMDPETAVPSEYGVPVSLRNNPNDARLRDETRVVLDSINLLPLLREDVAPATRPARQFAYAELFRTGGPDPMWPVSKAIRDTTGYKLIQIYQDATRSWRDELYQLERDPHETENLLRATASDEARLAHARLRRQLDEIETTGWTPRSVVATP